MTFRDRMRKAFGRGSSTKDGKPKIEYYRRSEVPRSKYRGPVDPQHRKQLRDWNFADATADRRRSFDLDLSPCTSLPDDARDTDEEVTESESDVEQRRLPIVRGGSITIAHHEIAPSGSVATGSQSSTLVGSTSYTSSMLTSKESWDWPMSKRDSLHSLKLALRYTSPVTRQISAPEKRLSASVDDLTRALNTVPICS